MKCFDSFLIHKKGSGGSPLPSLLMSLQQRRRSLFPGVATNETLLSARTDFCVSPGIVLERTVILRCGWRPERRMETDFSSLRQCPPPNRESLFPPLPLPPSQIRIRIKCPIRSAVLPVHSVMQMGRELSCCSRSAITRAADIPDDLSWLDDIPRL